MVERKDREPGFDGIDELDETRDIPVGLRSEDRHADERSASVNRSGSLPESAGSAGMPDSAASGLRTRVPPVGLDLDDTGAGDPGRAIRRAREALGLDATTLAYRTRLSLRTIEDLESNRLDVMPPAYVRGYLRAIARELSSDSEVWIRAYEGLGYTEPVLRPTLQQKAPARTGRRLGLVLLLLAGAGAGAFFYVEREHGDSLAGLLAWTQGVQDRWASVRFDADTATDTDAAPSDVQDAVPEDGGPRDTAVAEATERADTLTALEWAAEPGPARGDEAADETASLRMEPTPGPFDDALPPLRPEDLRSQDRNSQETAAAAAPASDPPVAPMAEIPIPDSAAEPVSEPLAEPVSEPVPEPVAEAVPGPTAESVPAATPESGIDIEPAAAIASPAALRLEFQETSWIEIRSASDRVVLQGIFHPGDDQALSVQLPARVMLGNAPGVTLYQQDIPVALEPYTRDNRTARFNLEAP